MITLETLAAKLNLELRNPTTPAEITHVASIASARPGSLVFATDRALNSRRDQLRRHSRNPAQRPL